MQEFSSISVSSYEAGSLAERLTEQSGDGWSVVAIVPTGSTVTAYLSRDGAGSDGSDHRAYSDDTSSDGPAIAEPAPEAAVEPGITAGTWDAGNTSSTDTGATDPNSDTSANAEHQGAALPADPVAEAPGWAAGASTSEATSTESDPVGSSSFGSGATTSTAHTDTNSTDTSSTDTSSTDTGATSTETGSTAAGGAAPAGWYADPSSRFELRYWDGGQWTEHVSRSGQQYTDPPVA